MSANYQIQQSPMTAESKKALVAAIPKLKGKKVLIIGDIALDEYIMGDVRRISPEASCSGFGSHRRGQAFGDGGQRRTKRGKFGW